jgi:hypothetical protein
MTEEKYKVVKEKYLTESLNTSPKKVLIDDQAILCILVGGPYTQRGESHPYGHVALRVIMGNQDITYDYGRYGLKWGVGGTEGEGMLNIWTDFNKYISSENSYGRVTKGYYFRVRKNAADQTVKHFDNKIKNKSPIRDIGIMKRYRIEDYHALKTNCTTISVDGALTALPFLMNGSDKYIEGYGLGLKEKLAAKAAGWPNRIFMPADLDNFLNSLCGDKAPYKTTTYGKGAK